MECAIELLFQYLTPTQKYNILNILTPKRTIFWESKPSKWYLGIDEVGMLRPSYAKPLGYLNLPSFDTKSFRNPEFWVFSSLASSYRCPILVWTKFPLSLGGSYNWQHDLCWKDGAGGAQSFCIGCSQSFSIQCPQVFKSGTGKSPISGYLHMKITYPYAFGILHCDIIFHQVGHKPNSKPSSIDS